MTSKLALVGVLLGPTFGCDPSIGVFRKVEARQRLSVSCVTQALTEARVTDLKRYDTPRGKVFTCRGNVVTPGYVQYAYRLKRLGFTVQVHESNSASRLVLHGTRIGSTMGDRELATRREVLDETYRMLRKYCKGLPPADEVREECWTVRCGKP